jgi:hypothetical protein
MLAPRCGVTEKRMFGGLAFLLHGHICCGVHRQEMIVRLHPEHFERALGEPYVRAFDLSGRKMKGWVLIGPQGVADDAALTAWLGLACDYAESLPPIEVS